MFSEEDTQQHTVIRSPVNSTQRPPSSALKNNRKQLRVAYTTTGINTSKIHEWRNATNEYYHHPVHVAMNNYARSVSYARDIPAVRVW